MMALMPVDGLPWRSDADPDARRPALPLPPARMPLMRGRRPLKRWRWVGVFSPRVMLCVGLARVGGVPQAWWAVWDREAQRLDEHTVGVGGRPGRAVVLEPGRVAVRDARGAAGLPLAIDVVLDEGAGVETVCAHASQYVWTRKQAPVPARGEVRIGAQRIVVDGFAVVDDTAGYHARETAWRWCAGVGRASGGNVVGWNLVEGVNDPAERSERSVWAAGRLGGAREAAPVSISPRLDVVRCAADGSELRFAAEASRERHESLVAVRSDYLQPFGTFSGVLPGGVELVEGFGVMEDHRARW
jgi:hypothetical protein